MRTHLTLFLAVLLLSGCLGSSPTGPDETTLAFETLVSSSQSGFDTARREVIRSNPEWAAVWKELHSGIRPGPPIPAVDFGREMVVLVATGTRSNGCYGVAVTGVTARTGGRVEIQVIESVPGPSCVCTAAITTPVHVVRAQRASGGEAFLEGVRTIQC